MTFQGEHGISWCDFTTNPIKYRRADGSTVWACVKVSPGCTNCYAHDLAHRYGKGTQFNDGEMQRITPYVDLVEIDRLLKSQKISGKVGFVGDMTDDYGPWVPHTMLDLLSAVFAIRQDVTWMTLTKRAERQRDHTNSLTLDRLEKAARALGRTLQFNGQWLVDLPLKNVRRGVSAEDQPRAEERVVRLLETDAAHRFVSYEPALGPVDFTRLRRTFDVPWPVYLNALTGHHTTENITDAVVLPPAFWPPLDLVIVGGESGHHAREFLADWALAVLRASRATGTGVHVKQMGAFAKSSELLMWRDGWTENRSQFKLQAKKGDVPTEWPAELRVRESVRRAA